MRYRLTGGWSKSQHAPSKPQSTFTLTFTLMSNLGVSVQPGLLLFGLWRESESHRKPANCAQQMAIQTQEHLAFRWQYWRPHECYFPKWYQLCQETCRNSLHISAVCAFPPCSPSTAEMTLNVLHFFLQDRGQSCLLIIKFIFNNFTLYQSILNGSTTEHKLLLHVVSLEYANET